MLMPRIYCAVRWLALAITMLSPRADKNEIERQRLAEQERDIAVIEKLGGLINAHPFNCLVFPDRRPVVAIVWGSDEVTDIDLTHLESLKELDSLALNCKKLTNAGLAHLKGLNRLKTLISTVRRSPALACGN